MLSQCTSLAHLWLGYAIIGDDLAWRGGWQRCARSAFHSHTRTLATTASELRGRGGFGLQLCHSLCWFFFDTLRSLQDHRRVH